MAALNDLISQIPDAALRDKIQKEVNKLSKQKKFGLVFEEHLPECTPLYDVPVQRGCNVMLRNSGANKTIYSVAKINDNQVDCVRADSDEHCIFDMQDIVRIAEFGEPIYPYLKPIDSICNAPDSDLWHTLIEADNYHALQLLEYLYAGKVDCIYIDPPYNTGARDWKYNNDYVDSSDSYRHSKWLSMMEKRLRLAQKLLNPINSVLIITIDEKEYLHLGCLLEELFPNAKMQMISSVISFKGSARKQQFTRLDEYIFFLEFGEASVQRLPLSDEWRINPNDARATHITWKYLIRSGGAGLRERSPGNFYPVFFTKEGKYHSVGMALEPEQSRDTVIPPDGTFAVFPIDTQGREHYWNINRDKFIEYHKKGYIKFGKKTKNGVPIMFLTSGEIKKVEQGIYKIDGYAEDGSIISNNEVRDIMPGTQWRITSHDATRHGTDLLTKVLSGRKFPYPKSLYAIHDVLAFFVAHNPNALIVDFFAGSGTTLQAVNLLNAEDDGHRQCIMVTNNEVSDDEAKSLSKLGYKPGDQEWERLGIARYVTWPRTTCTIRGVDINGNPLKGTYVGSDIPMADGFKANAAYFKLGFLDKTSVALGMQFRELLPVLWMKAGAVGPCPALGEGQLPDYMILPKNRFAVLLNENVFEDFRRKLEDHSEIETVFFVTDYEVNYRSMVSNIHVKNTYQLYRDYLDNFRINQGRSGR